MEKGAGVMSTKIINSPSQALASSMYWPPPGSLSLALFASNSRRREVNIEIIACELSGVIPIIQVENQKLKGVKRYAQSLQLIKVGVRTYAWLISKPCFHLADLISEWGLRTPNALLQGIGS